MPKLSSKMRQEIVDHLVGNCECDSEPLFSEEDSETLGKLDLDQLKVIASASNDTIYDGSVENEEEEFDFYVDEEDLEEATFNEEDLPEEILEELAFAREIKQKQKESLVDSIIGNSSSEAYTEKDLFEMDLEDLKKIEDLVSNSSASVKRVSTPKLGGNEQVANSSSLDNSDILEIPVIEFNG